MSDESPEPGPELCSLVRGKLPSKKSDCGVSDSPCQAPDMEDDTASEGVEVIVLEDEDFRDMFHGPEEEHIEHCMSRVSLQDHDYHQPREIMKVKYEHSKFTEL